MSNGTLKVFVSSTQVELSNERTAITELVHADPFLSKHVEAVLFENQPACTEPAEAAYLDDLDACDVYLGVLGFEYGDVGDDGLSAPHREYLRARKKRMPILFFIRGQSGLDKRRDEELMKLFHKIRDNKKGHTYRRFDDYRDLKEKVRKALLPLLEARGITPDRDEEREFEATLEGASDFDMHLVSGSSIQDLESDLIIPLVRIACGSNEVGDRDLLRFLLRRGLADYDREREDYALTSTGLMVFGREPDVMIPQCRIVGNAYSGKDRADLVDRLDTRTSARKALPWAIEDVFRFLIRNMRHVTRIVGFSRVSVDEYPYEALREVIVNAVAHRDYNLNGVSIRIEKYKDRLVVKSPGGPPRPVTMTKIRNLTYTPSSRNPNLARTLGYFERIEEQGDGIRRIVEDTANQGLPPVSFDMDEGYFTVTFKAPQVPLTRLEPKHTRILYEVNSSQVDRLNKNQRIIVKALLKTGEVTVAELTKRLKVTPQAIRKDMAKLQEMELIERRGAARSTYYTLKETDE